MTSPSLFKGLLPALFSFLMLLVPPVSAPAAAEGISIHDAWARASVGTSRPSAAYLLIRNRGGTDDALIAARADTVSARVEIHESLMDDGAMIMRQRARVVVPAGGEVVLKPRGLHIMLLALKQPLKKGASFELRLTFEKQGTITVPVRIESIGHGGGGMHKKSGG